MDACSEDVFAGLCIGLCRVLSFGKRRLRLVCTLFFACVYQFSASWVTFEIMCVVSSELAREIEHHRLAHWLARLCVMSHVFVSLLAVVFA